MSCNRSFLILILFSLFLLTSSAARLSNPSSFGASSSRNHHNHPHHHLHFMITSQSHLCGSFAGKTSQNLCIQFQILNQQQRFKVRAQPIPPVFSSPSGDDESQIDPRYGVEKRLVPSGPNPLHN